MFKNIKKLMVLGTLLITFGIGSITLAASNHSDSTWNNQYRFWSPNDNTPSRDKYNKTAYYNKTTSTVMVGYINIWAALGNGSDVSGGHTYQSRADGQEQFLYNLALENNPGKNKISVRINSSRFESGTADGVWSPDSVR